MTTWVAGIYDNIYLANYIFGNPSYGKGEELDYLKGPLQSKTLRDILWYRFSFLMIQHSQIIQSHLLLEAVFSGLIKMGDVILLK